MGNMQARLDILNESKKRMKSLSFGDPVTNVCAGDGNPQKHAYFVEYKMKSRSNRYGIIHKEYSARCTDKKGKFWDAGIETLHIGHLDSDKSKELFDPFWQAQYG